MAEKAPSNHSNDWLTKASTEELQRALAEINEIIKLRNCTLSGYEKRILNCLSLKDLSLVNFSSRRRKLIKALRENMDFQLQCRIIRRNMFYLRNRRDLLLQRLSELTEKSA